MSSLRLTQVAIQLYTLRDQCTTLPDFVATLQKCHDIGYRAVQLSGVKVPHAEAKKALDAAGMTICATHEPGHEILDQPEAVCARLQAVGVTQTAYPYPAGIDFKSEEAVRALAKKLDAAGAVFAKNGIMLSYHNHAIELTGFADTTVLDFIYQETKPANLKAELDTYWIQYGGGDPAAWIEKLSGRVPVLHLKDYGFGQDDKPFFAEIGHGNLNWPRIFAAAEKAGTEWLVVEQDTCPGDPFVSIKKSYDYLKSQLAA
jgi:sugar phosphate isomerase/epimerase